MILSTPRWRRRLLAGATLLLLSTAPSRAQEKAPDNIGDFLLDQFLKRPQAPQPGAKQPAKPVTPPKPMETTTIAGLSVAIWMPSDAAPRPLPLILFSHGLRACNTQSSFLMRALAEAGYLVIAPNHHDASCTRAAARRRPDERFGRASAWTEHSFEDRRNDMVALLDALRGQVPWSSLIDASRIGLAGHSLGGYTALGLAGGWESWRRKEIKAVLALSPFAEPFAQRGALDRVEAAVMYQGGTADLGITPTLRRPGGAYAKTPAPAYMIELRQANHLAWTDLQPRFQETISHYAVAFFDAHLRGASTAPLRERYGETADARAK